MGRFFANSRHGQEGQVLLVVVLAMVVALTVGLSLASRTVTNLRNTSEDTSSKRAFSAAEAGIEKSLKSGLEITNQQIDSQTTIKQVIIDPTFGETGFLINNGDPLPQDDGADIWLSDYPSYANPGCNGTCKNLRIYWGSTTLCNEAALEVMIISGTKSAPSMQRYALDPCGTRGNNFDAASGGGTFLGKTFTYSTSVDITNGLIARVIPLYHGTPIGIVATDANGTIVPMPSQGRLLTSVGSSGNAQRKISYYQGYDELPSELFYSIFQIQ